MRFSVHHQTVIDLVGKDDELVLPGNLHDLKQKLLWIERSRGVIGINDNNGFCLIRDFLPDIVKIRIPLRLLIADIVNCRASGKSGTGRPQGIIRRGDQNLAALVEKGGHTDIDQLAHTVSGIDIIDGNVGDIFELGVLHNCLACGKQTLCRRISLAFGELLAHVINDLVRR